MRSFFPLPKFFELEKKGSRRRLKTRLKKLPVSVNNFAALDPKKQLK